MKKKNLLILLMIPFLISTLTIVTVNVSYNFIDVDISYIDWDFEDIEPYEFEEGNPNYRIILTAKGVNNRHNEVSDGNQLVWSVVNKDGTDEPYATVSESNGVYYLNLLKPGEVVVTCANLKGNVTRSFEAILFRKGEGVVYLTMGTGESKYGKIDPVNYIGQYDLIGGQKVNASFDVQLVTAPESYVSKVTAVASDNLVLQLSDKHTVSGGKAYVSGHVDVIGEGEGKILPEVIGDGVIATREFDVQVVKDGVNVYSYDDLMSCTNKSENGEIVVLQTSFEAKKDFYDKGEVCFGKPVNGQFDFRNDVVPIKSSYNTSYLEQWNAYPAHSEKQLSTSIYAGVVVKKDFYGNGHMINMHNLTYPSDFFTENNVSVPNFDDNDLFRGPLAFYTVGDPGSLKIVSALGQDNVGFYVMNDKVTVNDVCIKSCDDVLVLDFLKWVGTTVEVAANDVTLKNMRISNGRQVLRSFSSMNLTVDNSMLSNASNFLFATGSNELVNVDTSSTFTFNHPEGPLSGKIDKLLSKKGNSLDNLLNSYINGKIGSGYTYKTTAEMEQAIRELQSALTNESIKNTFVGSTTINDCQFYRSGICSIALETYFNGPFLQQSETPSIINDFMGMLQQITGDKFVASGVSGTAYPVRVDLTGNTKFFDYKTWAEVNMSGLIDENISSFISSLGANYNVTIDDIFPIKRILQNMPFAAKDQNGVSKVNLPIAFYGGGTNYSIVTTNGLDEDIRKHINGANSASGGQVTPTKVDLLKEYLKLPVVKPILPQYEVDQNSLIKTVTIVTGYEPFGFTFMRDGYLINDTPSEEAMRQNLKNNEVQND